MFIIDERYTTSIQNFKFIEDSKNTTLPISHEDLDVVVQKVAEKIITTSQLRPIWIEMAQRELSLQEACCLIAQNTDKKYSLNTPIKIDNASEKATFIVTHVVRKLAADFTQLTTADLKVATLLFGIERISDLAANRTIFPSKIESKKEILEKLIAIRQQYPSTPSENMSPTAKAFLDQVDAKITRMSAELADKAAITEIEKQVS